MNHRMAVRTDWNKVSHRVHKVGVIHLRYRRSVMYVYVPLPQVAVESFEVKATGKASRAVVLDACGPIDRTSLVSVDLDTDSGSLWEALDGIKLTRGGSFYRKK